MPAADSRVCRTHQTVEGALTRLLASTACLPLPRMVCGLLIYVVIEGVSREFFEFGADTYLIIGYDARPYLDWSRSGLLSIAGNGFKNNQLSENSNESRFRPGCGNS